MPDHILGVLLWRRKLSKISPVPEIFIFSFKEQTKAKPKDLVLCSFVPNCSVSIGKGFILLGLCQRTEMLQNPGY